MDELFNFCKSALSTGLGVFIGLTAWACVRRELNKRAQSAAINRAAERMDKPNGGVEFIPVEDWPDSLEVRDK